MKSKAYNNATASQHVAMLYSFLYTTCCRANPRQIEVVEFGPKPAPSHLTDPINRCPYISQPSYYTR